MAEPNDECWLPALRWVELDVAKPEATPTLEARLTDEEVEGTTDISRSELDEVTG